MNKLVPYVLFIVGFAFFIQAALIVGLFSHEHRIPVDDGDPARFRLSVAESTIGCMVERQTGSLFGWVGAWMLLIYLKIRKLEQQVLQANSQKGMEKTGRTRGQDELTVPGVPPESQIP